MFSKVDLLLGYLQLSELAKDQRYLTSFVTHEGVYCFRSLPLRLDSSLSAFHQVVRIIHDGLEDCISILDDILIYDRSVAERLRRVLDRLVKYNAMVRQDKWLIGVPEIDFNGHRVSVAGIRALISVCR